MWAWWISLCVIFPLAFSQLDTPTLAPSSAPSSPPTVDPCSDFSCNDHGVCTAGVCACTGGWEGVHCEFVAKCSAEGGWTATSPGSTATRTCPAGQTGTNTRVCSSQGAWGIEVNTCVAPAMCSDKIKNQDETAVDCGGTVCAACSQCLTINCGAKGVCVDGSPPSCTCTGGYSGDRCELPPNPCLSVRCGSSGLCNTLTGLCVCSQNYTGSSCEFPPQPSCVDGIQNQNETAIDCGGNCPECVPYIWEALNWQECTVSCGGGTRTRVVRCTSGPGTVVSSVFCNLLHPTPTIEVCNLDACPTYTWRAGQFGICSSPCGSGNQTRPVECISSAGNVVVPASASTCPSATMPSPLITCNTNPCNENHWVAGTWFDCSRACGGGEQSRAVTCFDATKTVALEDQQCTAVKPVTKQTCNFQECLSYHWEACRHWSPCSATCGGGDGMLGQQWRDVFCMDDLGNYVDGNLCRNDTKPVTVVNICNSHKCATFNWMVTAPGWGPCEGGFRSRSFHCHTADGGNSLNEGCETFGGPKPLSRIPCIPGTCLVQNCPDAEVNRFFAVCTLNDFNLLGDETSPTVCSPECAAAHQAMLAAFSKPPYTPDTQQLCIEGYLGVPSFGVLVESAAQLIRRNLMCFTVSSAVHPLTWMAMGVAVLGALI